MAKIAVQVEQDKPEAERSPVLDAVRKMFLMGMGAVALSQEEAEKLVKRLVERGEIAEKDGKKLMTDLLERRRRHAHRAEQELDKRVEEILNRLNVPTKADIEALSAKITALTKKIDELKDRP